MSAKILLAAEIESLIGTLHLRASINLPAGVTALVGPSGAGKTSLADILAGLQRAGFSHIRLNDRVLADQGSSVMLRPEQRRIGYVFQDARLFPHLSVATNLRYGMAAGMRRWEDILGMLDLKPLLERRPGTLSGGEARRVAIGRVLLSEPELLILDEPLAGLDPARKERLYPYLEKICRNHKLPILFISHQIDEVIRLADYIQLIENGRTVPALPLEDAFSHPVMQRLIGRHDAGAILTARAESREDGLTRLDFPGGHLLTVEPFALGQNIRLRIQARDVSLSRRRPKDISILNILEGRITSIRGHGDEVDIGVAVANDNGGASNLIARITHHSAERLKLKPGEPVFALIKAVAVTRKLFSD